MKGDSSLGKWKKKERNCIQEGGNRGERGEKIQPTWSVASHSNRRTSEEEENTPVKIKTSYRGFYGV